MTKLAQLLLIVTSLVPIGLVYAAVLYEGGLLCFSLVVLGICSALFCLCWWLLTASRKRKTPISRHVVDPCSKESEPLAFLVAYALPLVAVSTPSGYIPLSVLVFIVIVGLIIWQQRIFHANPLLAFLGYHFYAAKKDNGAQVLVMSTDKTLASGDLQVIELSEYLWLHLEHKEDGNE